MVYTELMTPAQFLTNIHFQVPFGNQIQRDPHLSVCSIFKKHVVAIETQQTAAEIALSADWLARLDFRLAAREPFEVSAFVQASFKSRRRYFQSVGSMNEVFHIQNRPQMDAHFGA